MLGCANRAFYVPGREPAEIPIGLDCRIEEVSIPVGSDQLAAWVLEPSGETVVGTVVFAHGNAGNLGNHVYFADFLPLHGYRCLMFDYRGCGASTKISPTRESTIADTNAALDFVIERWGTPWLMGQSLGASIAIVVGAERKDAIYGVVAIAPFTSYRAVARSVLGGDTLLGYLTWPLGLLVTKGSDPIDRVQEISPKPLLLVHGEADEIIPTRMSREIYAKALDPKEIQLLPGVQHNDSWREVDDAFASTIIDFMGRYGDSSRSP